jgi:hypothetical protein
MESVDVTMLPQYVPVPGTVVGRYQNNSEKVRRGRKVPQSKG